MTLAKIDSFTEAVRRGIDAFEEAGRILVELIDEDPGTKDRIKEGNPGFSDDLLNTFERIGRKQLYYKLVINESPGLRALRRCPYSEQVRYFKEPIPMLLSDGKNETEHLLVSVHALTSAQARQVVGKNRVRSLGEQRAYLESLKRAPQPVSDGRPYVIRRGQISFPAIGLTLSAGEVARLLAEMTR